MGLKVGVVGVGPVGDRIIRVVKDRSFPVDGELIVMATSEREETLAGQTFLVRKIDASLFDELDVAFFAGKEGAKGASVLWGQVATQKGCVVVDNGGDFRMHPDYTLVVPEVNMDAVTPEDKHICSPNCSTIQMVVALAPLHRAFRLKLPGASAPPHNIRRSKVHPARDYISPSCGEDASESIGSFIHSFSSAQRVICNVTSETLGGIFNNPSIT